MLGRLNQLREAFPPEGLFADKDFLLSPEPFRIDQKLADELEKLGYRLSLFVRACNELYHRSATGKAPAWIADYLDRGKPPELVEYSRRKQSRQELPIVLRPDLVLTESEPDGRSGFTIAEIDSVPGGIGLTAWLNQTYAPFGGDILGGASGMIEGFRAALGGEADILVSQEAATYRPEMEWLSRMTGGALRVHVAEEWAEGRGTKIESLNLAPLPPDAAAFSESSSPGLRPLTPVIYRFFELFDLANLPSAPALMEAAARGEVRVTPPFKPYLEEKMWFALFWLRPLRDFWRRELSERHFLALQKCIPYTWLLDPTPLPQHAVIPELEINDWRELGEFSQKQRDLVLKISGFHELGWGSRSVSIGSDLPQHDWQAALARALASFEHHPYLLQRFHKGRLVEQPFFDPVTGAVQTMRGRVRLCPYYFMLDGKAELRGALATICPADKKLLHGMKDAILAPTAVSG